MPHNQHDSVMLFLKAAASLCSPIMIKTPPGYGRHEPF
jgi:hypothetical protein